MGISKRSLLANILFINKLFNKQLYAGIPFILVYRVYKINISLHFKWLLWQQWDISYHGNLIFSTNISGNKLWIHMESLVKKYNIMKKLQMKTQFDVNSTFSLKTIHVHLREWFFSPINNAVFFSKTVQLQQLIYKNISGKSFFPIGNL